MMNTMCFGVYPYENNDDAAIVKFLHQGNLTDPLRFPPLSAEHWREYKARPENRGGALFSLRYTPRAVLTHVFCGSARSFPMRTSYLFFNFFGSPDRKALSEFFQASIYQEFSELQTIVDGADQEYEITLQNIGFRKIEQESYLRYNRKLSGEGLTVCPPGQVIEYENVSADKLAIVASIYNQAFSQDLSYVARSAEDFSDHGLGSNKRLWTLSLGERPVAMAITEKDHQALYVDTIATAPEFRRQGFARTILQNILKGSHDLQEIRLQVHAGNSPAVNLYSELGFEEYMVKSRLSFCRTLDL